MNNRVHPILIVEDSLDDYYATTRGLKKAGLNNGFIHCETGEDALDYLLKRGDHADNPDWVLPQVIMLDLNLPGMDGHDVLKKIKTTGALRSIPVIILTTSDNPVDIETSYANGANSYITKPVDKDGFMAALSHFNDYWFNVVILPED